VDSTGTITTLTVQNNTPFYPFRVNNDAGIAVDSAGNLFVSDGLAVVWKIDPTGNAAIVAGTAWGFGFGGDGGPATQALLLIPAGVAVDASGNLYIADWLNNRIRRVDTNGIINTVAGNGTQGFSGDGGPAGNAGLSLPEDIATDSAGNLYIADFINFRIRVVDPAGIINTVVGSGAVGYNGERVPSKQVNVLPSAVTLDSAGGIFFSDSGSYRVRKVGK
jgi:sugar lactone lactonase YvrE